MSELKTEEEQIEAFKAWWKKNGTALVLAVAVGVGGYFGWQGWQTSQANHVAEASALYQSLTEAATDLSKEDNQQTVRFVAQQLSEDYEDTGYALFGQLFLARVDAEAGNYDAAISALNKAMDSSEDASFDAIAKIRIARLQAEQGDHGAAMTTLENVTGDEFAGQVHELKGDILLAQGKREEARSAYEAAVAAMGANAQHPLLDIKLKDLVQG
ncbi:YfgM family protein [Rhodanobacter aciditrophus]|uniref:Ancillary SecYEG translocon subunit n=1 Tax=Rhodanobacter aciditrophus TaxID=1623218 RepID=A0ABW4AZ65_9GAMM